MKSLKIFFLFFHNGAGLSGIQWNRQQHNMLLIVARELGHSSKDAVVFVRLNFSAVLLPNIFCSNFCCAFPLLSLLLFFFFGKQPLCSPRSSLFLLSLQHVSFFDIVPDLFAGRSGQECCALVDTQHWGRWMFHCCQRSG